MNDYSSVIEAIDRLTAAVNQTSNSFTSEFLSAVLATVGSVAAVLIFELIKNEILVPRDEFRKLQRKVNSMLTMYARYYSNPVHGDRPMMSEKTIEDYISAATDVRRMAVEVIAFADARKRKKCYGIAAEDIRSAGGALIGLSNSFFFTGDRSDRDYTKEQEHEIRQLLRIAKEK